MEPVPEGLEPKGYRRRYVYRLLRGPIPCFSIGMHDPFEGRDSPVWLRFHTATPKFSVILERFGSTYSATPLGQSGGHIGISLDVPLEVDGEQMVADLRAQAEAVLRIAYKPMG